MPRDPPTLSIPVTVGRASRETPDTAGTRNVGLVTLRAGSPLCRPSGVAASGEVRGLRAGKLRLGGERYLFRRNEK